MAMTAITAQDEKMLIEILKDQVKPALGCTEPGAVGLAVARAKELLGAAIEKMDITVDKNMLKNGLNVGIPGTHERGLIFAAALAVVVGKSADGLEVFRQTTDQDVAKALELVAQNRIAIALDPLAEGLYICVEAQGQGHQSRVIIEKAHTNLVYESRDDEVIKDLRQAREARHNTEFGENDAGKNGAGKQELAVEAEINRLIKYEIKKYSIDALIEFSQRVPLDLVPFILDGINMNMRIAEAGVKDNRGIGLGQYLLKSAHDARALAKAYTAAASEARMAGSPLPVMSSAGSGNHGLVAVLPIAVFGRESNAAQEKIIRSVMLSHLITILVKVYLGALSPVCGCGVAAGVGCAAGLVLLQGGSNDQIKGAINNMAAGLTGMICDGAKLSCASKLAIATEAAFDAADTALAGIFIPSDNGILGNTAEQTIINMARISNDGMKQTDKVILEVMLGRC